MPYLKFTNWTIDLGITAILGLRVVSVSEDVGAGLLQVTLQPGDSVGIAIGSPLQLPLSAAVYADILSTLQAPSLAYMASLGAGALASGRAFDFTSASIVGDTITIAWPFTRNLSATAACKITSWNYDGINHAVYCYLSPFASDGGLVAGEQAGFTLPASIYALFDAKISALLTDVKALPPQMHDGLSKDLSVGVITPDGM